MKEQSAVFIMHEDSCSGAPIAMLGNISILANHGHAKPDVCVLKRKGGLTTALQDVASDVFFPAQHRGLTARIVNRFVGTDLQRKKLINRLAGYDAVYLNTVVALNAFSIEELRQFRRVVLFIYEMPLAMSMILGAQIEKLAAVHVIFAPSEILASLLRRNPHVHAPIQILHQYIDPKRVMEREAGTIAPAAVDGAFTVGMIGSPIWAKTFEYFLCIAKLFDTTWPDMNVRFVWKGAQQSPDYFNIYSEDIRKAGLSHRVVLEPNTAYVSDFYATIDMLALSSREDTYPNVMIEAALFNKPTVCFSESGGAEYFVTGSGGTVVPFLDIRRFCEVIYEYAVDRARCQQHGRQARDFAIRNHCDQELIYRQLTAGIS